MPIPEEERKAELEKIAREEADRVEGVEFNGLGWHSGSRNHLVQFLKGDDPTPDCKIPGTRVEDREWNVIRAKIRSFLREPIGDFG